jgi:predicted GIY-YIG superfamily endonuclease
MKEKFFVYTLSYDNVIFYIGCSKDVVKRYKVHLACKKYCSLYNFINKIKSTGNVPVLNIITFSPRQEALSIERTLIKCIDIGGQKLLNTQNVPSGIKNIFYGDKKTAIEAVKERQAFYIKTLTTYQAYYKPYIERVK